MESPARSLYKTLSWRFVATIITTFLTWGITGDASLGLTVGVADTTIKLVCYYFHERTWSNIKLGYKEPKVAKDYQI